MGGEDLKILITGKLNIGKTIGEINTAIRGIEKAIKPVKLKVEIDPNTLNAIKKIAQVIPKNMPKIDMSASTKQAQKDMKDFTEKNVKYQVENTAKAVADARKLLGDKASGFHVIDTTELRNEENELKSFIVSLKQANGEMRQVTFELAKFKGQNGETEIKWASTLIKDLDMSESAMKKLNEMKTKLQSSVNVSKTKGNIDEDTYKRMIENIKNAGDLHTLMANDGVNKELQAEYQTHVKITQQIEKQQALIEKKMNNKRIEGTVDPVKFNDMQYDLYMAKREGSMESLTNFTKKYHNELEALTASQKRFTTMQDNMRTHVEKLGNEGKITTDNFQMFNRIIDGARNIRQLKNIGTALTEIERKANNMHDIELFQRQANINASKVQSNYGANVDSVALQQYLDKVNSLSASSHTLTEQMKNLNMEFKEISEKARIATSSSSSAIGEVTRSSVKYIADDIKDAKNQLEKVFNNSTINVSQIKNGDDTLKSFIVDVRDLEGYIKRVNYELKEVVNVDGSKEIKWVSTWIKDMDMSETELRKLINLQDELTNKLKVMFTKGKIDQNQYTTLVGNISKANNMEELNGFKQTNNLLLAQYQTEKDITEQIQKQTDAYSKRIRDIEITGKLSDQQMNRMKADFTNASRTANRTGQTWALDNFAKQWDSQLRNMTATEKAFMNLNEKVMNQIISLGNSGKYTTTEMTKLKDAFFNATNIEGLKGVEVLIKELKSVNAEIAKQRTMLEDKMKEASIKGKVPQNTSNQMQQDFLSAQQVGTLKAYQDFAKKYREELELLSPAEKALIKLQDELRQKLIELQSEGKIATSVLRAMGTAINVNPTIQKLNEVKNRMEALKYKDDITLSLRESFQKLYDKGLITLESLKRFKNLIDNSKNIRELQTLENEFKNIENHYKQIDNLKKFQAKANNDKANLLQTHSATVDKQALEDWMKAVNALKKTTPELAREIEKLKNKFNGLKGEAQDASRSSMSILDAFSTALVKFPVWMGVTTMFYGTIHAMQQMSTTLIELDTQMMQLKKVMDEGTDFDRMLESSVQIAEKFHATIQDVNTAMIGFAKQGMDEKQTIALAETSSALQLVSDLGSDESMQVLTSAMAQFNKTAEESLGIVDALNEVDNKEAVSTRQLAEGMAHAGETAQTFGVSMETLLGQITSVAVTTRESGQVVGNALKTIYSRITTMDDSKNALANIGVEVEKMDGSFRNVSDILTDVHEKWGKLSNAQQQNLAVTLAGRYQLTR